MNIQNELGNKQIFLCELESPLTFLSPPPGLYLAFRASVLPSVFQSNLRFSIRISPPPALCAAFERLPTYGMTGGQHIILP